MKIEIARCVCVPLGTVALQCQASPRSIARAASVTWPLPLLLPLTRRGPPQHQATKTCRVALRSLSRPTVPIPRRLVTAWTVCLPHRRRRPCLNEARRPCWQERRQRDDLTAILPNTSSNSSSSNNSSVMKSHSWLAWVRRCVTTLWIEWWANPRPRSRLPASPWTSPRRSSPRARSGCLLFTVCHLELPNPGYIRYFLSH